MCWRGPHLSSCDVEGEAQAVAGGPGHGDKTAPWMRDDFRMESPQDSDTVLDVTRAYGIRQLVFKQNRK